MQNEANSYAKLGSTEVCCSQCRHCLTTSDGRSWCGKLYYCDGTHKQVKGTDYCAWGCKSCKFCRGAGYTEEEFTVTTQLGRTVRTQFKFCPNCGRNLMRGAENG